ncbi:MAG: TonB-dependent receptor [Panacagrimonas sp.]
MKQGKRLKKLAWVVAVELALMQPGFAQDEPIATDAVAEPAAAGEPQALPEGGAEASAEAPVAEAAPVETAQAEEAPAEEESGGGGVRNRMLEEIVVTAQKREENLQEVPSSVQAFSSGQLEASGINDIKDLQLITPGLTFDSMASYSIIFIRGVGGDAFQAGIDSSVATYIDGLYLPFTFSSAQALGDVKQIEVLKGPQGTLYGRNAIAGAIKVELKEPCNDGYCGDILQQFGNYNDTKTKLGFSGPVPFTDNTVSFGVSGLYQDHEAHTIYALDNDVTYRPYRNASSRGVLRWEPNEDFDIQGSYYDVRQQDTDSVATVLLKASPAFQLALTPIDRPHESGNQENVGVEAISRIITVGATARWVPWFDIRLVYGDITAESTIRFDYDSAPEPVLDISAIPNTAESKIAELIFSSNPAETPDWLEWIGGIYYEDTLKTGRYPIFVEPIALGLGIAGNTQTNSDGVEVLTTSAQALAATLANFGLIDANTASEIGQNGALCGIFQGIGGDCNADANTNQNIFLEVPLSSGVTTDALAAYAQFTFHVSEKTSVVLGGRYSTEDRDLLYSKIGARLNIPAGAGLGGIIPILNEIIAPDDFQSGTFTAVSFKPQTHTWNSFTPNLGLNYKLNDETLFYYRYAEAFKSGNFNGLNVTDPPDRIEPELAATNELGMKTELLDDNSIKLNVALFTTKINNAQVQNLSLASGGVTSLQNAGTYVVKGAELETSWFLTESLVVSLSGVYLDGEYVDFIGRAFKAPPDGIGFSDEQIDFKGNKTVRTPEFTGTLAINYTFPFFFGLEAEVGGDVYANDGFFYDPLNSLEQVAYQIWSARAGLFDPRSNIRLTFFGKNLTDDVFFTNKYRQDFGDTGIYGAARTYGAFVSWSF